MAKTLDIVVEKVERNEYGDLLVTDENGLSHKIGKKRDHLFNYFNKGNSVQLIFDVYKGHEYVADAVMVDGTASSPKQVEDTPIREDLTAQNIAQQVAIKEIGECWRAGKMVKGDTFDDILVENYKAWIGKQVGVEKK